MWCSEHAQCSSIEHISTCLAQAIRESSLSFLTQKPPLLRCLAAASVTIGKLKTLRKRTAFFIKVTSRSFVQSIKSKVHNPCHRTCVFKSLIFSHIGVFHDGAVATSAPPPRCPAVAFCVRNRSVKDSCVMTALYHNRVVASMHPPRIRRAWLVFRTYVLGGADTQLTENRSAAVKLL